MDPLAIAQSLVLFMLIPLGLGLVVRARYPELADDSVGRPATRRRSDSSSDRRRPPTDVAPVIGSIGPWIFMGLPI